MMRRAARGYSFLEIMLVVAMMSVLTAAVLPSARVASRSVKERQLSRDLTRVRAAIDAYHRDWEHGCIESDDEGGWPRDLEELHDGVEWSDSAACQPGEDPNRGTPPTAVGERPRRDLGGKKKVDKKIYLARIPRDPFNREGDEWDTMGWKGRSYVDDSDSTSWSGKGLYDVHSASELTGLNGVVYSQW